AHQRTGGRQQIPPAGSRATIGWDVGDGIVLPNTPAIAARGVAEEVGRQQSAAPASRQSRAHRQTEKRKETDTTRDDRNDVTTRWYDRPSNINRRQSLKS